MSSYFTGIEAQKKVHPLVYMSLDYSFYETKTHSTVKAMKKAYRGLDISYPFLKYTSYLNVNYHIFKSHLNLAGFYKAKLNVPLKLGVGFMNMGKRKTHFSVKWGLSPSLELSPHWETQLLFTQTVSADKFQFLYSWLSLGLTFKF